MAAFNKMKLFASLLCIAIGSVFGELERRKFAKENLEVNEDIEEARALNYPDDGEKPYTGSSEENLRVKSARGDSFDQLASSAKDADSSEKEISRNPSPVIDTSIVKPSSSKTIRKILEIMHLRKPARHSKELREISRRNRTESNTLRRISFNFLKRLLSGTPALIRNTTNHLGGGSRKVLRRKRATSEVEDPPDAMKSLKVCAQLRKKLPAALRLKMLSTDEEKMIEAYAASKEKTVDIVSDYNSAKMEEREQLRQAKAAASGPEAKAILKTYKTLRKGTPWNCLRLRGKFKRFFSTPSDALKEYEEIKRDELQGVDGFLLEYNQLAAAWQQQQEEDVIEEDIDEVNAEEFRRKRVELPEWRDDRSKRSGEDEQFTTGQPKTEIGEVKDDQNSAQSRDEYLKQFKEPLRIQLENTDAAEKIVLLSYVESDYMPDNVLDDYYAERAKEIQLLKTERTEAGPKKAELLKVYKSIRKGSVWNFMKKGSKERQAFFKKSSSGRKEYEDLKKMELEIDHYLDGSRPIEAKAPERDDKAEAEGIEKASAIEKDKSRQEEDGSEKVATTTKHGDDPENVESSRKVQKDIQSKLSEWLSGRVTVTNTAEEALLDGYAEATAASANLLADYNDAKAKEREVVKLEMAGGGAEAVAMLANYKKLRKGVPWNSVKLQDKYKTFFDTPSAALTEYLDLKKDELSIDVFLTGDHAVTVAGGDMVTREVSGRARAKARFAERARATEVMGIYKTLRKGKPWNYIQLRGKFKGFFGKTSSSLTDYENLKQDEAASINSSFSGSSNSGSVQPAANAPFQEKEKPAESSNTTETEDKFCGYLDVYLKDPQNKIGISSGASSLRPWTFRLFSSFFPAVRASKENVPDLKEDPPVPPVCPLYECVFPVVYTIMVSFLLGAMVCVNLCINMINDLGFCDGGAVKGSFAAWVTTYMAHSPGTKLARLFSHLQGIGQRGFDQFELFVVVVIGGFIGASLCIVFMVIILCIALLLQR